MELWFGLPKVMGLCQICLNYGVHLNFPKVMGLRFSFAKNMEFYQVLPNLWNYVKFCPKEGKYFFFLPNLWSYVQFFPIHMILTLHSQGRRQ
jgi:hypothetical protein